MSCACPDGGYEESDGVAIQQTGLPVPPFNGVFGFGRDVAAAAVLSAVDEMAGRGLPWNVQLRPGYPAELDDAFAERGLIVTEQIPFMVLTEVSGLPELPEAGTARRLVTFADVDSVLRLLEEGFGMPAELTRNAFPMAMLFLRGVSTWLVEAGGADVSTALGATREGVCGIFNVATPEAQRGRGYGAGATAAALRAGFDAGADLAYLQSSPMGLSVYERLGFRTAERWTQWMPKEYLQPAE
jgi:hypothetical protein